MEHAKSCALEYLAAAIPNMLKIGDIIIGVVKDASPNMPVKRSDVIRAVIVRNKKNITQNRMECK